MITQVFPSQILLTDIDVFQVVTFIGFPSLITLSIIGACMNLICSVGWVVLVAIEGGIFKWNYKHSMPLSKTRVAIIMAAIVIGLAMDCFHLYLGTSHGRHPLDGIKHKHIVLIVWAVIVFRLWALYHATHQQ